MIHKTAALIAMVLGQCGLAWAVQATYGGSSAPEDGISLKSPKKDCPCCDDLTRCPCDGIGAPSWFPTAKPIQLGLQPPDSPGKAAVPGRAPDKTNSSPSRTNQQETPRSPEETFPPITGNPLQPRSTDSISWFTTAAFKVRIAPLRLTLDVEPGGTFDSNLLNMVGSPVSPPSSGGGSGGIPPGPVPGPPPPPPPSTKAGSAFGDDSDESDDSDTPFLIGPEIALPLKGDVTEWNAFRWMPEGTTLTLYGHVLVGEMEIFDASVDVELYGVGLGLAVPLFSADPFSIALLMAAGPGFLRTDLGDTVGAHGSTGFQATLRLSQSLALVASLDVVGFFAPEAKAWGPAANLGLVLSW